MKKFKIDIIITGVLVLLLSVSCDYLEKEPDPELTMDMVYSSKVKVEDALSYIYLGLPNPSKGYLNSIGWEIFADDITVSKRWQQWDWPNIPKIFGQWTPNTGWDGNFWADYPKRIRESYLFRKNVKALPEKDLPQSEVDFMKAECRFLAAYYWWNLAKTYGPIPFKPDYIAPSNFNLSELLTPRTHFDTIVNYLDKEMLEASKLLPATYGAAEKYGRVTSIMCLTERARMLLFAASPLCNGNEWYTSYTNKDGKPLFSAQYSQAKWERAAEACKLLITEAENAGHKLFVKYNSDGTVDAFKSVEDLFFTKFTSGNKEILFPFTRTEHLEDNFKYYTNRVITPEFGGSGGVGVYQGLVDAFFTKNGLPINDPNSGYTESGFTSAKETRTTEWTGGTGVKGEITPSGIYKMYSNREPRFYTTVSYNGSWYNIANRPFEFFKNQKDNNYTHDAPQNGYLLRKKVYPYDNPKTNSWLNSRPIWLYRLGAAYLDFAEANNEAYDNSAARQEALTYLNKIRERAGVRKYTTSAVSADDENFIHVDDTKEALRKVIRMERRVELACEGTRWDDIRRWKIAEELPEMTGNDYGMNYAGTNAGEFYQRVPFQTRVWKKAYYWFPIFIDEVEKNQNLVQAPFWN